MDFIQSLSGLMFSWVETFGYLGLFVASIVGTSTIFLPLPVEGMILLAGGFLNPFLVGLLAGLGTSIGELTAYYIGKGGRYVLEKTNTNDLEQADKKQNKTMQISRKLFDRVEGWFNKFGFWTIPALAFVPLPMDIIGVVCGAIGYDVKKFFVGILIGKMIRSFLLAWSASHAAPWVAKLFELF